MDNNTPPNDKTFSKTQDSDSLTVVNWDLREPRGTVGFKCNKELWNAFVLYCKANYGSVCHVLEPVIVALLTNKVNLSKTIRPLHIENLNVERAVRRVRRYSVEKEEVEVSKVVEAEKCAVCGRGAYARAIDVDGARFLCRVDFAKVRPRLLGWKVLEA